MNAKTKGRVSALDVEIGAKLLEIRTAKDKTQQDLAAAVGISFQQIQKYEKGGDRISLSRAAELCEALDVPVWALLPARYGSERGLVKEIDAQRREIERLRALCSRVAGELVKETQPKKGR